MKEFKNRTKVMIGFDALDRIGYEVYYNNCCNALVIYDNDSDVCGSKRKLKRILNNNKASISYVRVQVDSVATWKNVKKCYEACRSCNADYIICLGTSVVVDIGKAVKALVSMNKDSFDQVEKIEIDDKLQLVVAPISTGDHCNLASNFFSVYDEENNIFYKFNCKNISPNVIALDSRILDKVSDTSILEMELSALCMSFLGLVDCKNDNNKICAMIAIDIINDAFKENRRLTLAQVISAQMYAGIAFMNIEKNILDEFICQTMLRTGACYDKVLLNMVRGCFAEMLCQIPAQDIAMIGNVFGATFRQNQVNEWQKKLLNLLIVNGKNILKTSILLKGLVVLELTERILMKLLPKLQLRLVMVKIAKKLCDLKNCCSKSSN